MNKTLPLRPLGRLILPLAMCLAALPAAAQKVRHPLDPLNFQEYWQVLETLRGAGRVDAATRFSLINMIPPAKESVWKWKQGESFPRSAFALVRQGERTVQGRHRPASRQIDFVGRVARHPARTGFSKSAAR